MEVYFDNAATTKVSEAAATAMMTMLTEDYGNPSSLHGKGLVAEKAVEKSRKIIADQLKVSKTDVYFTSGGTEANNMAFYGIGKAYKRDGDHILVSSIEHPSAKDAAIELSDMGYEVEVIPADGDGYIQVDVVAEMIRPTTVLVSVMHVNNEIGTIQPIESLAKTIKSKNPKTLFHVDGVQSFGKYVLYPSRVGVDLMTISGHKIHGPKGVGAIYVNPKAKILPLIHGGSQQRGLRSGTENVPGIVGLGVAAEEAYLALEERQKTIAQVRTYFIEQVSQHLDDIVFNSDLEKGAYHIVNFRAVGIKSEVLLHTLEEKGIYVSTGSACSSNKKKHSSTLQAMGQDASATDQAVRVSFSKDNTCDDVNYFVKEMAAVVPLLRRIKKK